jgi:signal transduction histidine kinase
VVDNRRAKSYKGSKPTPIDSLADTSKLALEKYEKAQQEATTLLIYLIVGSILISSIAVFIFFYLHNDKQKNAVTSGKNIVKKTSNDWFKKITSLFTFSKKTKSKVTIPYQNGQLHHSNATEQNNRSNEIAKMLHSKVVMLEKEISLLSQKTAELSKRNNELHYTIDKFDGSEEMLKQLQTQKEALTSMYHADKIWLPSDEEVSFMMDVIEGYDLNAINQQQVAMEIKEVANSISKISRDITKVLMLETEKLTVETSPNDIQKLIVSTHKKYKKLCDEKEISLNFSALTKIPPFLFDPIKIEEAYDYLLNNAITYSYPKTGVTVSAFIENKNVIVEINDQGPGITKEDLYSAFTKGAEKLSATQSDQQVKGVSLWVVKKMIDAHNGKIWVKSRIGKGATFAFSLPLE